MKPALIPIRGIGTLGLNTDILDFDLPFQAVTTAKNVIFSEGNIRKGIGYSLLTDIPELPLIDGVGPQRYEAVWFEAWVGTDGSAYLIVIGRDTLVNSEDRAWVYNAGTKAWDDAMGAARAAYGTGWTVAGDWQSTVFGGTVVINNGVESPEYLVIQVTPEFAVLPDWDPTWVAQVIRGYRNFLVALNLEEGSSIEPNAVRWSDASGVSDIPQLWTAAPTNLAGKTFISSEDGVIVDAQPLNNAFMIYTNRATHAMNFVGGTALMSIRKVFQAGLYDRNAVATFDTYHFNIGRVGIYTNDGQQVNHIGQDRIENNFYSLITEDTGFVRGYLVTDRSQKIAAHFFPTVLSGGNQDAALVYNWHTNTFSYQRFADQATPLEFVKADFSPLSGETTTWRDFQDVPAYPPADGETWADQSGKRWSDYREDAVQPRLILLGDDGRFYHAGEQFWHRDGGAFEAQVIRQGIDLDDIIQKDTQGVKHIFRILPQMDGQGTVRFRFGTSMMPSSAYSWSDYIDFVIGTDYKVDVRLPGGRYLAYEIYSNDSDGFWKISGFDLDVRLEGYN